MTRLTPAALGAMLALAPAAAGAQGAPGPSAAVTISGELTRVDLARRAITLKTEGRDAREMESALTAQTRLLSRGRDLRLEDLRPGDRVTVVAVEEAGTRQARVVKVNSRITIAPPSPLRPSPAASGVPPGTHS